MITNLKNDKLLFFLKRKKYPYKRQNKAFVFWVSVIALLVLTAILVYALIKYTYSKFDICDLSARTVYKNGIEQYHRQSSQTSVE